MANKKPYFFIYRYPKLMQAYKENLQKYQELSHFTFSETHPLHSQFIEDSPVIDYGSPMNLVCHYMESNLSEITPPRISPTPEVISALITSFTPPPKEALDKIDILCKEYYQVKKMYRNKEDVYIDKELISGFEKYEKYLRKKALEIDYPNLGDLAVHYAYVLNKHNAYSFIWSIFQEQIIENIKENSIETPKVPIKNPNGDISLFYENYSMEPIDV